MKPVIYKFETSEILRRALALSSSLGASRTDEAGNILFEMLSVTEDDYILVQQFLREAIPEIKSKLLAYSPNISFICRDDSEIIEAVCFRVVPHDDCFNQILSDINELILNYFSYYVVFSWLSVKKPDEAALFGTKANSFLDEISVLLNKRIKPITRKNRFF